MATVNIKSAVRVRPLTEDEQAIGVSNEDIAVSIDGSTVLLRTPDEQTAAFAVNFAYAPEVTHQQIYGEMVAPLTLRVFDGYNASVITFGTTGSGKQYSLLGDDRDPGLVERAANDLFSRISSDQSKRFLVTFSMYQINKEFIVDLLNPVLDSGLELAHSRAFGCVLPGLAELIVHGADEVKELLQQGRKVMAALLRKGLGESPNLVTGALPSPSDTKPHFIAEIKVEAQQNGNFISPTVYSTFRFVCCAGSGGMAIDTDQSLKSLVSVVELLGAGRDPSVVPYSSSALTRILETNLGGNSSTVVLVAIDPLASSFEDSSRSLQVAEQSAHIANRPSLNANTVLATIQELREEIRQTRGKLNLSDPSNYMNEVDTTLLDRLKSLMTQLETTKNSTWDAKIKRSQKLMEERKDNLNKAGLFIVLEEDVSADAELMRKVEKERRNLVLQTYVVEQKESKLVREQDTLQTLVRSGTARPEDMKKSEEAINELTKTVTHQKEKLEKMKSNFAKYIAQLVELEERQRKTFLTAEESSRLHVAKDAEDWKEIEALKGGDPKLREKLKEVQSEHHMLLESIDSRYAEVTTVPVSVAKQLETAHASSQRQLKEKLEEMRWERDQLLGRLIERDFRHEVQMGRMQKQMFMVFREYRRHFEEQKSRMEMRYRQLLEDSIQDVLKLQSRNTELESQIERTNKERAFTLSQSSFASVATAALANARSSNS